MEEKLQFEDALKKLEELTAKLEGGEGTFEETVKQYEECMQLVQLCNDRLDAYEKKFATLNGADEE